MSTEKSGSMKMREEALRLGQENLTDELGKGNFCGAKGEKPRLQDIQEGIRGKDIKAVVVI